MSVLEARWIRWFNYNVKHLLSEKKFKPDYYSCNFYAKVYSEAMMPWISKLSKRLRVLIQYLWTLLLQPCHLIFPEYSWRELSEITGRVWCKEFKTHKTLKFTHPTNISNDYYKPETQPGVFSNQSERIKAMCPRNESTFSACKPMPKHLIT